MARRLIAKGSPTPEPTRPISVPHDPVSEAVVIAACACDRALRKTHLRILRSDHFLVREHAEIWTAFAELEKQNLDYDQEAIERFSSPKAAQALQEIVQVRPDVPANLEWHVQNVIWDKIRAEAIKGPIASLVEAIRNPTSDQESVRTFARQVATAFEGGSDRKFLLDGREMVRQNMRDLDARRSGRETYPYGIPGLDLYEPENGISRRRLVAGTRPGMITVVTSSTGAGKTTVTANIMLGLRKLKRRILYCAWEMSGRLTLEILAGMELGWLRADLMNPDTAEDAPINTREGQIAFEEMQHEINKHIRFAENPFKKRIAEKPSNERNLDIVHQLISDSGCEVFVADLWKRCLATGKSKPDDEEDALIRQQAMVEELKVHGILLQQQRIKDIEQRPDKRPTREGIMGSSAWVAVADCILGIHRPFLWKKVTDDRLEVNVLKQRYAPWPLAIEFDWDPTRGLISGGRSMEYTRPGETSELDQAAGFGKFLGGAGRKRKS